MIDPEKQVAYWRKGAEEAFEVACHLVDRGNTREGLFLSHLAVEKMLKAHVCKETAELAPRIHDLLRLSRLTKLDPTDHQNRLLGLINTFCLEGRYPEAWSYAP